MNYNGAMNFKRKNVAFVRGIAASWSLTFSRKNVCAPLRLHVGARRMKESRAKREDTGLLRYVIIVLLMLFPLYFFTLLRLCFISRMVGEFSSLVCWRHKQGMLWIAQYCF